jgi:hypothetical protein
MWNNSRYKATCVCGITVDKRRQLATCQYIDSELIHCSTVVYRRNVTTQTSTSNQRLISIQNYNSITDITVAVSIISMFCLRRSWGLGTLACPPDPQPFTVFECRTLFRSPLPCRTIQGCRTIRRCCTIRINTVNPRWAKRACVSTPTFPLRRHAEARESRARRIILVHAILFHVNSETKNNKNLKLL